MQGDDIGFPGGSILNSLIGILKIYFIYYFYFISWARQVQHRAVPRLELLYDLRVADVGSAHDEGRHSPCVLLHP